MKNKKELQTLTHKKKIGREMRGSMEEVLEI